MGHKTSLNRSEQANQGTWLIIRRGEGKNWLYLRKRGRGVWHRDCCYTYKLSPFVPSSFIITTASLDLINRSNLLASVRLYTWRRASLQRKSYRVKAEMSALFGGAISKRAATNLWALWMWLIINNSINTRWLQLRLCLRLEAAAHEWIYWLWSEGHKWGETVDEMRTDPSCCPRQGEVRDPRPCLRWLLHLFTSVLVLGKQKSDVFRTANSQDVFEVLYAIIYKFCAYFFCLLPFSALLL